MSEPVKRALVTGGSGGIGAAICRRLARDGHHVYVHARQGVDAAEKLVAEITAAGGSAVALHFDVTDAESTRETLAAALGLSPFHFARMFRQRLGTPPHRYLAQLRLEAARRLLRTGQRPLAGVAAACGFSSPSAFARAFRQATGVTPGAYRRGAGGPA